MSPLLTAAVMLSPHVGPDGASEAAWERLIRRDPALAVRWATELGPAGRAAARPLLRAASDRTPQNPKDKNFMTVEERRGITAAAAAAFGIDAVPALREAIAADYRRDISAVHPSATWTAVAELDTARPGRPPPDPAVVAVALSTLRAFVASPETDDSGKGMAVSWLGIAAAGGVRVVPDLTELLDHPHEYVRRAAAVVLVSLMDHAPPARLRRPAVPTVGFDRFPADRLPTLRADLAAAVPALLRVMTTDPFRRPRKSAAKALAAGATAPAVVLPRLLAPWDRPSPQRIAAGQPPANPPLLDPRRKWDFNDAVWAVDAYAAADAADAARVRAVLDRRLPAVLGEMDPFRVELLASKVSPDRFPKSLAVAESLAAATDAALAARPAARPDGRPDPYVDAAVAAAAERRKPLRALREALAERLDVLRNGEAPADAVPPATTPEPPDPPPVSLTPAYVLAAVLNGGGGGPTRTPPSSHGPWSAWGRRARRRPTGPPPRCSPPRRTRTRGCGPRRRTRWARTRRRFGPSRKRSPPPSAGS